MQHAPWLVLHTCRPSQEEEDARQKQLKSYCGLLLEEREDEVVEALTSDQFSAAGAASWTCVNAWSRQRMRQGRSVMSVMRASA